MSSSDELGGKKIAPSWFHVNRRGDKRQNTDISQVSQGPKRFLAENEVKERDSDQEILPFMTKVQAPTHK